jgi:hypothetical protein
LVSWILDALGRTWDVSSIVPACICKVFVFSFLVYLFVYYYYYYYYFFFFFVIKNTKGCGLLGICFCFSNWRSYYRVTGEYLERLMPEIAENQQKHQQLQQQQKDEEANYETLRTQEINKQTGQDKKSNDLETSINTEQERNQQTNSDGQSHIVNSNNSNKDNVNLTPMPTPTTKKRNQLGQNLEKISAIGGSILKAVASSASWFTFIDGFFGLWISLSTTLVFLPACILSQIAFLSIADGGADDVEEEEYEIIRQNEHIQIVIEHSKPNTNQNSSFPYSDNNNNFASEKRPLLYQHPRNFFLEQNPNSSLNHISSQSPWPSQRRYTNTSQQFSSRRFRSHKSQEQGKEEKSLLSTLWCFHP